MINLTFKIQDISEVVKVYNQIEAQWSTDYEGPFATVSGAAFPINLIAGTSEYTAQDPYGEASFWYRARYICVSGTANQLCVDNICEGQESNWSDPILGETGVIYYDPTYPVERVYTTDEQLVIDRIRRLIGDPIGLKREFNERDNIHPDGEIYELETKGWPASISIGGDTFSYNSISEVSVNNYRYLKFSLDITEDTGSGVPDVDIAYYVFRHSDREIMEAYDTCPPPAGLTTTTATSEVYMLATAIDLLNQETWEDLTEDGSVITDEASRRDPSPGLRGRDAMLERLQKRLDDLVMRLLLSGISGVLLD